MGRIVPCGLVRTLCSFKEGSLNYIITLLPPQKILSFPANLVSCIAVHAWANAVSHHIGGCGISS